MKVTSLSALPTTVNNASITSNMVPVGWSFSNPEAQTSDWSISTAEGKLGISGTISGTTDVTFYFEGQTAI